MKITKRQLKRIIKEEKRKLLSEMGHPGSNDRFVSTTEQIKVAEAQEKIEEILNKLYDSGVENDGLKALLNKIIHDIDSGFVGEPT